MRAGQIILTEGLESVPSVRIILTEGTGSTHEAVRIILTSDSSLFLRSCQEALFSQTSNQYNFTRIIEVSGYRANPKLRTFKNETQRRLYILGQLNLFALAQKCYCVAVSSETVYQVAPGSYDRINRYNFVIFNVGEMAL